MTEEWTGISFPFTKNQGRPRVRRRGKRDPDATRSRLTTSILIGPFGVTPPSSHTRFWRLERFPFPSHLKVSSLRPNRLQFRTPLSLHSPQRRFPHLHQQRRTFLRNTTLPLNLRGGCKFLKSHPITSGNSDCYMTATWPTASLRLFAFA